MHNANLSTITLKSNVFTASSLQISFKLGSSTFSSNKKDTTNLSADKNPACSAFDNRVERWIWKQMKGSDK